MVRKQTVQETVLYYNPVQNSDVIKLKGILVRMGIRIRNVAENQADELIGALIGLPGFAEIRKSEQCDEKVLHKITEEVLVMHNFSSQRLDELLLNLRKAGVPRIHLKAVVTETNCNWTFYQLYEELKQEHARMKEISH